LSGDELGDRREIVCLNAAPILYIAGHAFDLSDGMEKAAEIIDSGKPIKKLKEWVSEQNANPAEKLERLDKMLDLAYAES
jgi:anthranilate phosphoribosyltransferase